DQHEDRNDLLRQLLHGRRIVHDVIPWRAMRTSLCWLALVAVARSATSIGCNRDKAGPAGGSAGNEGSAASRSSSPGGSTVELFVDDVSVARLRQPQLAPWPRLDSLVPDEARRLGTWELVTLQGKGAKPTE